MSSMSFIKAFNEGWVIILYMIYHLSTKSPQDNSHNKKSA